jgi:hypothetical protein
MLVTDTNVTNKHETDIQYCIGRTLFPTTENILSMLAANKHYKTKQKRKEPTCELQILTAAFARQKNK